MSLYNSTYIYMIDLLYILQMYTYIYIYELYYIYIYNYQFFSRTRVT